MRDAGLIDLWEGFTAMWKTSDYVVRGIIALTFPVAFPVTVVVCTGAYLLGRLASFITRT